MKDQDWAAAKRILCIRADNMGDVLMSSPAFRALKETFSCEITLLTSTKGAKIVPFIPQIDKVIEFDLPWVQSDSMNPPPALQNLTDQLKEQAFDACIIFTVYSQNPLPAALLAYQAGIPLRLAYCRENPYQLLTDWVPDQEPYDFILHQVERDLKLVRSIGARSRKKKLIFRCKAQEDELQESLQRLIQPLPTCYMIFHPGVQDPKRRFPFERWVELARAVYEHYSIPIFICGSGAEQEMAEQLALQAGPGVKSLAGQLSMEQWALMTRRALVVISVNTGAVHLAAAMNTPVVVLYAQSNPQHIPWMVPNIVLEYGVPESLKSKNEVIAFVNKKHYRRRKSLPSSSKVIRSIQQVVRKRP